MKPLFCALFLSCLSAAASEIKLERVPEGGVQPQVAVQPDGTVHLVYLKGEPGGADVRYTRRGSGDSAWQPAVTVNSIPKSAVAAGTIRGAQIALGKAGRAHVVWNGAAIGGKHASAPLYYARMEDGKFAAQRAMNGDTKHLDGGASVAATEAGEVFIAWHASPKLETKEAGRLVYICRSTDDGRTFSAPAAGNAAAPGVCACCSLKVFAGSDGTLMTLYRNASAPAQRDMALLTSRDGGHTFTQRVIHPWPVAACPMSSATLVSESKATRAAWETDGAIFTALTGESAKPLAVSKGKARHPALAVNAKGETLISWSVGTGWQRGGELAWVLMDAAGKPSDQRGTARDVPVWSHTAAFALQGGDFVILH